MNPLVSAIMLTTWPKRADMMMQACHSFQIQQYQPMELVIVNDGAPLRTAVPRDWYVRIVQAPPSLSIGEKRNIGIKAARGKYVATWDDDDFSFPERISLQMSKIDETGAKYHRFRRQWLSDSSLRVIGLDTKNACLSTSLIDRNTLLKVGGYPDLSYLEDMEADIRMAWRSVPRIASEEPVYIHRRHQSNVSSLYSDQTLETRAAKLDMSCPQDIQRTNQRLVELLSGYCKILVVPIS